jgi:hypothetical protein
MAKRQGSILSFFGNANDPTQQKNIVIEIKEVTILKSFN